MENTILIVDDTDNIRVVLEAAFSPIYNVLCASNGETAIDLLSKHTVDVVILDINMPVTDGWETLRIIKDPDNGWPDLPIVILSVHKEPENALKAWYLGATHYVRKPFSVKQLCEIIHDTVRTSHGAV